MDSNDEPIQSFDAIWRDDARVLILGSMPSVASLAATRYYGNPQNAFWPIMGELFGAGPELDYDSRCQQLQAHQVALWDVCRSCRRDGSSDASIRDVEPNAIADLVRRSPNLEMLACNGTKAFDLFERLVRKSEAETFSTLEIVRLPSTSPAHASLNRAQKLLAWRAVLPRSGRTKDRS